MTVTVGIIIGVTILFTICSIAVGRRAGDGDDEFVAAGSKTWENGGRDLTSPLVGEHGAAVSAEVIVTPETPQFERLAMPEGSRIRPIMSEPEAPVTCASGEATPADVAPELSDEIIRGLEQVPPLPKAVQAVMRELDSAAASAKSVGEIVASDPVVGAVVLRVVNSAATGLRRRVLSVQEAVAYLGFAQVRTLIMKLKVSQLFRAPAAEAQCYDMDSLWQHSMAVAQVADRVARRTGKADPDLASTLGLLHDIGKLAINCQFPQKVAQLWRPMGLVGGSVGATGESWLARERRLFGADHAFMGGFLAARWMLPEEITDGIRLHHPSSEAALLGVSEAVRKAVQIVHVANQLVKYRHCYCADMEIDMLDPAMLSDLNLPAEMEQMFDETIERAIAAASAMARSSATGVERGSGMRASA